MSYKTPEDFSIGFTNTVNFTVTDKTVSSFAEMSGDHNPIHVDEEFAKTTRFGRRIAHGMISAAFISAALVETFGHGGVYLGQNLKFVSPVYIGDELEVILTVDGIRKEKGIVTITTNVRKKTGEIVVKGDAVIMVGNFLFNKA